VCSIRSWQPAGKGVAHLNQNRYDAESDDAGLSRDRTVSFEIDENTGDEDRDLETKFQAPVIPKTKADLQNVIVDGEIGTVDDQIQDPMRKDSKSDDQCRCV